MNGALVLAAGLLGGAFLLSKKSAGTSKPVSVDGFPVGPPGVPGYDKATVDGAVVLHTIGSETVQVFKPEFANMIANSTVKLEPVKRSDGWAIYRVSPKGITTVQELKYIANQQGFFLIGSFSLVCRPTTEEQWVVVAAQPYLTIASPPRRFALFDVPGSLPSGKPLVTIPCNESTEQHPNENDLDAQATCPVRTEYVRIIHDNTISKEDTIKAAQIAFASGHPIAASYLRTAAETRGGEKPYPLDPLEWEYTIKGTGDVPWILACQATGDGARYKELFPLNPELKQSGQYVTPWKKGQVVVCPEDWDQNLQHNCPVPPPKPVDPNDPDPEDPNLSWPVDIAKSFPEDPPFNPDGDDGVDGTNDVGGDSPNEWLSLLNDAGGD